MSRLILFFGVTALPVYLGQSGGIQIAHFLIFCFSLITLHKWLAKLEKFHVYLGIFVFYTFLRESISIIDGGSAKELMPAVYWFYNLILCASIVEWSKNRKNITAIVFGIYCSAAIAVLGVLIFGFSLTNSAEGVTRAVGTFNNPNQLGYYSVCLASFSMLFRIYNLVGKRIHQLTIATALFLAVASLSKAAMLSIFICIIFSLMPKKFSIKEISLTITSVVLLGLGIFIMFATIGLDDLKFMSRLADIGKDHDDSLAARGYFVFLEGSVAQILFGLSSASVKSILGTEVHSTLAGIFNNYGIFGFALFLIALTTWIKRVWNTLGLSGIWVIVVPAMFYGLTHNGARFSIFWLLVSVSLALTAITPQKSDSRSKNNRVVR